MIVWALLKVLSQKDNLNAYLHLIDLKLLSKEAIEVLKGYQAYFNSKERNVIDFNDFSDFFCIIHQPNLDEKSVEKYKKLISEVQQVPESGKDCSQIIISFEQQELYAQLHRDLDQNVDIETVSSKVEKVRNRLSLFKSPLEAQGEEMDLTLALDRTDRTGGLQWRLDCLKELFGGGGLIKGDFGIIAGFVDTGKTSFIASEVSYMAQQLDGDQYIAWLNTEGSWEQLIPRIYCATLNCTSADLRQKPEKAKEAYQKRMKGDLNRIKIFNMQRKSTKDVENLIKQKPPSLIIFDLLDGLRGFEGYMKGDGNVTERYSQLYQWAREVATNTCPVLAVSQLNGDGNNDPYPTITNLRGSRVDKQAAATFQLIIGGLEGNSTERYLSMPKNKVSSQKGWRQPVRFCPLRCRFSDN